MGFLDRVKKDLQKAMKEGAVLIREGTSVLKTEARRMGEKAVSAETRRKMKKGIATARKGAATVQAETVRMAQIANLRYQLFRENQMAEGKFAEIGGAVYDLGAKGSRHVPMNAKVRKLISEAEKIEAKIGRLKSEIGRLSTTKRG